MQYLYAFVVWPDETWTWDRAVFDFFRIKRRRVEMQFTQTDFERFRSGLAHHGLTLREVTLRPHALPEPVASLRSDSHDQKTGRSRGSL